jgi:abortive infection bacteriophage resistance protein
VPKYTKLPLLLAGQLQKLKSRGLQIEDDGEALHYLLNIGYYRLSAYMLIGGPFSAGLFAGLSG